MSLFSHLAKAQPMCVETTTTRKTVPPATTLTVTPAPTTTGATVCKDKHWKCSNKWKNKCHKQDVKRTCPLTCKTCTTQMTPTSTTTTPECKDATWKCQGKWKNPCSAKRSHSCKETCGLC